MSIQAPIPEQEALALLQNWADRGDKMSLIVISLTTRSPKTAVTNAERPAANSVPVGTMYFNTSDQAPNWAGSDGNWHDATGAIT